MKIEMISYVFLTSCKIPWISLGVIRPIFNKRIKSYVTLSKSRDSVIRSHRSP